MFYIYICVYVHTHTYTMADTVCGSRYNPQCERASGGLCCDIYAAILKSGCNINATNQETADVAVRTLIDASKAQGRCSEDDASCYSVCEVDEFFSAGQCVACTRCITLGLFTVERCTRLSDAVCKPLGEVVSLNSSTGVLALTEGRYFGKGTCGGMVDNQRMLTIEAPDGAASAVVIDCSADGTRHFDVMEGSTLVLKEVTLLNGGSEDIENGGCVRVIGNMSAFVAVHVVMTGCIAQYGGGLYASDGAVVTLGAGSVLYGNSATQDGGCVYGEMTIVCVCVCVCVFSLW